MSTKHLLKITALIILVVTFNLVKSFASTIIVNSNITVNTTWVNTNVYVVTGFVYVTNGATLTINAGTLIEGDSATLGSLIITRGAKIHAVGTACSPIVFTSEKPAGQRKRGDWGGVILLGYAAVNWPGDTGHIEGIVPNPNTRYGGGLNPNCGGGDCPNNSDNSGVMQYVRIEFAGVALSPNNEINGLTFGGVGNGTTLDHIQVSYANDDSYEWFGGHNDAKYLVSFRGIDDDWDTDNGYSGRNQFLVDLRDPTVADVSGSKGYESDNDPTGTTDLPQTRGIFCNVTSLAGADTTSNPLFISGAHIRRNSHLYIYNSISMGWPEGILIDGTASQNNVLADTMIDNCIWANKSIECVTASPSGNSSVINLLTTGVHNHFYTGNASVKLTDPYNLTSPNFQPLPGSPALTLGTSYQHVGLSGDPFFTHVTYLGAFDGTNDWTGSWTNWDPVNAVYSGKIDYTPHVTANTITNVICPNTGGVDINVSGGLTPYSYQWSNGATTQDIAGVAKGVYTVTVYDAGRNCSVTSKRFKVSATVPILTSCSSTSTSITVFWSGNIAGYVSGYQIRYKKHSVSTYGGWTSAGNGNSKTITGLLTNTQYDFQLRGTCTSGFTGISTVLTCSTTSRLSNETASGQMINIYPNPSAGQFTIDLNGFASGSLVSLKVSNILGKVVYSAANVSADAPIDMNLESLPSGMYNVVASDGTNQLSQNIILNK